MSISRLLLVATAALLIGAVSASATDVIFVEDISAAAIHRLTINQTDASGDIIWEESLDGNADFGVETDFLTYEHSVDGIEPPAIPGGMIKSARLKLFLRNSKHQEIEANIDGSDLENLRRRIFIVKSYCRGHIAIEDTPLGDGKIVITLEQDDDGGMFILHRSVFDMRYIPDTHTDVGTTDGNMPQAFELKGNYPNPFNPSTTIEYSLASRSRVDIQIYDVLGRKIRTLISADRPAGDYSAEWDATDDFGRSVGSGVYFYRLTTDGFVQAKKMILLK